MNYKKISITAFILMCIAQLFVPAKMITGQEDVLKTGKVFKFRTAPVDPNDPFRGKYITLNYQDDEFPAPDMNILKGKNQQLYVELKTDGDGFAKIINVSKIRPAHPDYIISNNHYQTRRNNQDLISIQFPFDRFYMEEFKAPAAEKAYRESNRDTSVVTYALVYIKDGDVVLEDVVMDGISIKDQAEMQLDDK